MKVLEFGGKGGGVHLHFIFTVYQANLVYIEIERTGTEERAETRKGGGGRVREGPQEPRCVIGDQGCDRHTLSSRFPGTDVRAGQ